jgi:hypothetical protein
MSLSPTLLASISAAIAGPAGLLLVAWWKRIFPGRQEQADVASTVASAFQKLLESAQADTVRQTAQIKEMRDQIHKTNNKLMKLESWARVAAKIAHLKDSYIESLRVQIISIGATPIAPPVMPELPQLSID